MRSAPLGSRDKGKRNSKKFQKPLDKATKVWYNNYEKRKENLTNQKGIYYEEEFPPVPRYSADQLR